MVFFIATSGETREDAAMLGDARIRPLVDQDEAFLWEALYHAIYVAPGQPVPRWDIVKDPALSRYVEGWGRAGDMGTIAELADGRPVGACWLRVWHGLERGYGYVDEWTPELSLAVLPEFRRQGIGSALVQAALTMAGERGVGVSLSVTTTNPAMQLYCRFGFRALKEEEDATVMVWESQR